MLLTPQDWTFTVSQQGSEFFNGYCERFCRVLSQSKTNQADNVSHVHTLFIQHSAIFTPSRETIYLCPFNREEGGGEVFCICELTRMEGKTLSVETSYSRLSDTTSPIYSRSENCFGRNKAKCLMNLWTQSFTSHLQRSGDTGHFKGRDRERFQSSHSLLDSCYFKGNLQH